MNDVSATWCALPWQGAVLQPWGDTQVCCLVDSIRKSSIDEYINSSELAALKQDMLDGKKPTQCNVCWKNEQQGLTSWRQRKNKQFSHLTSTDQKKDVAYHSLDYIELYISNKCNSKCRMCKPKWSTAWIPEYRDPTIKSIFNYSQEVEQQVVKYNHLSKDVLDDLVTRINDKETHTYLSLRGGEPCYAEETFHVLSKIKNPANVSIDLTTNGTIVNKNILQILSRFKGILLGLSIDASQGLNQYIRGNDTPNSILIENIKQYLNLPNIDSFFISNTIMIYNAFDNNKMKTELDSALGFTPTYDDKILYHPAHLKIHILPSDIKRKIPNYEIMTSAYTGQEDKTLLNKWYVFTKKVDELRKQNIISMVPELALLYMDLENG